MVRVRVVILVLLYLGVIRSQLNFRGRSNQIDLDAVKMIIVLSIHVFPSPLEVFHSGILPLRIIRMVFNSHRSSSIFYWWLKLLWRWTHRHDTLQIFKHPCSIITPLCFHYASFWPLMHTTRTCYMLFHCQWQFKLQELYSAYLTMHFSRWKKSIRNY